MAERLYDITEIAKRTRESLKKEFPNLTFSVTKESFSGGSSMSVILMKGNFNPFVDSDEEYVQLNKNSIDRDERLTDEAKRVMTRAAEIAQIYNWDNSDPMTDYFDVNYYLHIGIGKWDKPYEMVAGKPSEKSGEKKSYPMGEMLDDCSGWTIFKKTLPDGRIVYNAKIKATTPKNRGDWNSIKGEIYTETGFKWGKFGAFEKWGQIASEAFVIKTLCKILGKYYLSDKTEETPAPEMPAPQEEKTRPESIKKLAEEVINLEFDIWNRLGIKSGGQLLRDENLQEKYASEVKSVIIPYLDKYVLSSTGKIDFSAELTNENAHKLNNALALIGYFGQDTKEEYILDYNQDPNYFLNPKYYTEKPESEERLLFMVGDIFYVNDGIGEKYYISSINSNDEVGFASLKRPKAEAILGKVEDVNKLFKEGKLIKSGRYDYSEETPKANSKEDIEKAIKGLQYLADKGNEKAIKAIKGLKYLLNK